jgi:hypothetical protein
LHVPNLDLEKIGNALADQTASVRGRFPGFMTVTDASVVAVAERQRAVRIATLNRRHFAVVCPPHADAFELLP